MSPPPRCVICHDDLGDANAPYATVCGHLCCEECSAFHFSFDTETPCPFCRRPIKRDQLFRLYFDFNAEDEREEEEEVVVPLGRTQRELVEAARSVGEACKQAVNDPAGLDAGGIRVKAEAAEDLVQTLGPIPQIKPILASLGGVLADMRARLQQLSEERDLEAYKDRLVRLESKYSHKVKNARGETERIRQILQETLDVHQRTQADLQAKLQAVRRDFEQLERQSALREDALTGLEAESIALKASNLKYRKKVSINSTFFKLFDHTDAPFCLQYHAMKQTMTETKRQGIPERQRMPENADDSLMIVG
ncbi:hypothetical protein EUX98_g7139 [Antrodiella citrinella]|uniref:RING-type domain-containing protein n=1 Tax=Antrodiella citrinella TaxID=2447956 RepID=A0A4S4MMX8_9APHY|nr:hypothetical protein EUX98_g7139 [Antrodiella citrinella]